MFAFHFGWTPRTVDALTVEDFYVLAGWLERHEESKKTQDEE